MTLDVEICIEPQTKRIDCLLYQYFFIDYTQVLASSCTFDDIACKVATTVISHKPESETLVVDCGWTAFGLDGPEENSNWPATLGRAPVEGHPELMYELLLFSCIIYLDFAFIKVNVSIF